MRNAIQVLFSIVILFLTGNTAFAQNSRKITDFNSGWLFEQDDWIGLNNASQFSWNDSTWIPVRTPHCFNAADTFDPVQGYYRGFAWYRKHFRVPASEKGRVIKIYFGAIGNVSEIWVNEKYYGRTVLGYVPIEIDITNNINWDGDNLIAVRVQNLHDDEIPPGRWRMDYNVYGGIYREVTLESLPKVHFRKNDFVVTTPEVNEKESTLNISATVFNREATEEPVEIRCRLLDGTKTLATFSQKTSVPSGVAVMIKKLSANIPDIRLWSPSSPNRYLLETSLFQDGKQTDQLTVKIGFRTSHFDPEKGYFINGKPLKLRGLNRHQDYPGLGNAVPVRLQIEDAEIMKNLGANYVRCSHYPQHESFLNACDSLGLLVYEEVASWQHIGGEEFIQNMDDMMQAMIRRDRNHPCIFLWGMMNEGRSAKLFKKLGKTAQLLDPTRPTCYAENHIDEGIKQGTIFMPGVAGLNYDMDKYNRLHQDFPQLALINTECTNGDKSFIGNLESQLLAADKIKADLDYSDSRSWLAGACIWCFHDYGTEYKPVWPIQTSGVVDVYRRYKEQAWMLKARWSQEPFIRIAGNWWYPGDEGKIKEVRVWDNCDEVHLFLNGKEIPKSDKNSWQVAYEPGTLKAVGKKGHTKVEYSVQTPGKPVGLKFQALDKKLKSDGYDTLPVIAQIVDENGNLVPVNGKTVSFSTSGPGTLVGIGNDTKILTTDGEAVILVKSSGSSGTIEVTAKCESMKESKLTLSAGDL